MTLTILSETGQHALPSRDPLSHTTIHTYRVRSSDIGATGFVTGGTVLDWVHRAGHATATRWSGTRCVAASLTNFHLDRPIGVDDRVEVRAQLVYTGNSSLHVLVTVLIGDPTASGIVQTAQCPVVFVAVDELGDTVAVPAWTPVTMLELQLQRQARVRIRTRRLVEDAIAAQSYVRGETAPCVTRHILVSRADGRRDATVHGGRVIRWIDEAANACAAEWCRAGGLTSYVASIRFRFPVVVGDRITLTARLVHTGPRSVHVGVRAVTTDAVTGMTRVAAEGLVVVAALDADRRARPVRRWTPETPDDIDLDRHGLALTTLRQSFEPYSTVSVRPSSPGSANDGTRRHRRR